MTQPQAFLSNIDTWVPNNFNKVMQRPDIWWEPIVNEFEMLKEQGVFKVVPRPVGKNVVGSK